MNKFGREVDSYLTNPSKQEFKEMMNINPLQLDSILMILGRIFQKIK